jgi:hypothetical protein
MKIFGKFFLLLNLVLPLYSCGEGESFIQDIVYNVADEDVEVGVEFNNYFNLELEASIPILKYGTLNFIPAGRKTGAIFSFSLNMNILNDKDLVSLKKTRMLPNGSPMTNYVESDLLWLYLKNQKNVHPSFYLGTDVDDFYMGSSLQFAFIDEEFPEKLTVTQRFRDSKGRLVGAMTIFGPRLYNNGSVRDYGGIFFVTNATDLKEFIEQDKAEVRSKGVSSTEIIVKKDGKDYKMSDMELKELVEKLNKKIKEFNKSQK